jgi:hypothetical protein
VRTPRWSGRKLYPVWRYHPLFTNNTEPVTDADITHRQHAILESVLADFIDGTLAHMPSGFFPPNSAWTVLAAITHNLLRAAGTLAGIAMRWPAEPPSVGTWSRSQPGSPDPKASERCIYLFTGPEPRTGHAVDSVFTNDTQQVTV